MQIAKRLCKCRNTVRSIDEPLDLVLANTLAVIAIFVSQHDVEICNIETFAERGQSTGASRSNDLDYQAKTVLESYNNRD